jgi:hypothetical protein
MQLTLTRRILISAEGKQLGAPEAPGSCCVWILDHHHAEVSGCWWRMLTSSVKKMEQESDKDHDDVEHCS